MAWMPATAALLAAALLLTGCAADGSTASARDAGTDAGPGAGRAAVQVVASTDVYGDIATSIGGPDVHVHAMIDSPTRDPHEFQADARDQLALASADVVIVNGAGYDDFMTRMLAAAHAHPTVITVADLPAARATAHDGRVNEHFWYDMAIMRQFAGHLETALADARPARAAGFAHRAAAFEKGLSGLQNTEKTLRARYSGAPVAITEPVPLAMLQAIGLRDRTPAAFSRAVEDDQPVAPSVMKRMLDLMAGGQVAALVYNSQSAGAQTALVRKAAEQGGVAVVPVAETLPAGAHYLGWMRGNLERIGAALAHAHAGHDAAAASGATVPAAPATSGAAAPAASGAAAPAASATPAPGALAASGATTPAALATGGAGS